MADIPTDGDALYGAIRHATPAILVCMEVRSLLDRLRVLIADTMPDNAVRAEHDALEQLEARFKDAAHGRSMRVPGGAQI